MTQLPLKSSHIDIVDYDEDTHTLQVHFKNSNLIYEYLDVPEKTVRELVAADSPGRYFAIHIVGQFTTRKRR